MNVKGIWFLTLSVEKWEAFVEALKIEKSQNRQPYKDSALKSKNALQYHISILPDFTIKMIKNGLMQTIDVQSDPKCQNAWNRVKDLRSTLIDYFDWFDWVTLGKESVIWQGLSLPKIHTLRLFCWIDQKNSLPLRQIKIIKSFSKETHWYLLIQEWFNSILAVKQS